VLSVCLKLLEFGVVYPVNTVYGAGINGFLNNLLRVAILAIDPRATIVGLDVKGVAGNVGTVFAADAGNLIHIDAPLAQLAA
jgi:hypothetical protein